MYKIMIVDDNPLIRMGLKNMIDWKRFHAELAGEAGRGEEILKLLELQTPDLLITDIRMPGKDGLYVLDKACRQYPNMDTIVISAYNEFAYAKQAIKAGSVDYILKPIDPKELNEAIHHAVERKVGHEEIEAYDHGTVCMVLKCREDYLRSDIMAYLADFQNIDISLEHGIFRISYRKELYQYQAIQRALNQHLKGSFLLGKGCMEKGITARAAWEQALSDANADFIRKAGAMGMAALLTSDRCSAENIMKLCKSGSQKELSEVYGSFRNDALQNSGGQIERWADSLEKFLRVLLIMDTQAMFGVRTVMERVERQKTELLYTEQKEVDNEIGTLITAICKSFSRKAGSKKDLALKVKEFVDSCYAEEISPGRIAELFSVSLPYLSKVFKQETGIGLSSYITQVRIRKAKYLIENTDKKVSEVADMVGYSDVNYFTKIYKRYTGLTPGKTNKLK